LEVDAVWVQGRQHLVMVRVPVIQQFFEDKPNVKIIVKILYANPLDFPPVSRFRADRMAGFGEVVWRVKKNK
jgi:hypothetical protein